jgi:hypothetical protein
MWRYPITIYAQASRAGHDNKTEVLKLSKPAAYPVGMRTYLFSSIAL